MGVEVQNEQVVNALPIETVGKTPDLSPYHEPY